MTELLFVGLGLAIVFGFFFLRRKDSKGSAGYSGGSSKNENTNLK